MRNVSLPLHWAEINKGITRRGRALADGIENEPGRRQGREAVGCVAWATLLLLLLLMYTCGCSAARALVRADNKEEKGPGDIYARRKIYENIDGAESARARKLEAELSPSLSR